MSLSFISKLNKGNSKWRFPVPLSYNQHVIEFCNEEKVNVTISKKRKSITFIAKAAKFGSKGTGDRRVFIIPKVLYPNLSALCSEDPVKITLEKRTNSSFI